MTFKNFVVEPLSRSHISVISCFREFVILDWLNLGHATRIWSAVISSLHSSYILFPWPTNKCCQVQKKIYKMKKI